MTQLRHVHFIAVGGTGMGALAGLLKARGLEVTGSDQNLYPPMSTVLERWEVPVYRGYHAVHVLDRRPDLVVIGNAVRPDNPEARAAIDHGLPYLSFPDALYQLAIREKHSVVVTGTHGKTTTTSIIAALLYATGRDPSFLVGGIALDFGSSFREGQGKHFVVEGDEYDTAFFDKTPKFLHYGAQTLVVTSVEFDHADIYRDLEHVKSAFRRLVLQMPVDGTIVAALGHADVRDVVTNAPCRIVGYGTEDPGSVSWRARSIVVNRSGTAFDVERDGTVVAHARCALFGRSNVENVLGSLVVLETLGVPIEGAVAALPAFRGVKRRQEVRGEGRGVTVIDDFAHHPTAVRASIQAVRARFPDRRLIAVFEPRSNTSRRTVFQKDYAQSFDGVHHAVVAVVPDVPIYSATGEVTEKFSSARLAEDLREQKRSAVALDGVSNIVEHLGDMCESGDVVLIMSNGPFDNICERLLETLAG